MKWTNCLKPSNLVYEYSFEKQLKSKLAQKLKARMDEEGLLLRSFKFFDITGKGSLGKLNFIKTMERIGVILEPKVTLMSIIGF